MKKEIPYDQLQQAFEVLQELDQLRKTKLFCDFVIKVESKEIHVHRNILCANSAYFKAMLSHNTVENQSGVVEFKDMDCEIVILCTDFIYGRKISISREKWEDCMHCADRLQLLKLKIFLEKFLKSALAPDSFYDIRRIANTYSCKELAEACDKFAPENFYAISQLAEFAHLEKDYVVLLVTSELNKASEASKTKALLRWISFDLDNRSNFVFEMLKNINLSKLPKTYIRYLIEEDLVTSRSLECVKILSLSAMNSSGVSSSMDYVLDESNCVAVFDDTSRHLQCFDPAKNTSTQMQSLHPDMKQDTFSAITLNDHIYVLMKDKSVYRLKYTDPNANWYQMTDMTNEHGDCPPAVADTRYIYVLGCSGSGEMSSKVVEKYDTITANWEYVTQLKSASQDFSCVLLKRHIYCIGGYELGKYCRSVQILDLDSNNWTSATPLPHSGGFLGVTSHLGKIYVAGGQDHGRPVSRVECYNPEDNTWTSLLPIPTGRTVLPVITIGDSIFAIGGYKAQQSRVDRYDIKDNKWTEIEVQNMKTLWCVGLYINY